MTGKRPDEWSMDQLEEMSQIAAKLAANLARVVHSMKASGMESLVLQARKKHSAISELYTWSQFDLAKALDRQSTMRAKGAQLAESSKKNRRKSTAPRTAVREPRS